MLNDRSPISLIYRRTDRFDRSYKPQGPCRPVVRCVMVVLLTVLTNLMYREAEGYKVPGLANDVVLTAGNPDISVETVESQDFQNLTQGVKHRFHSLITIRIQKLEVHPGT